MDRSGSGNVVEEILSHYGVKGMRWGVNRSRQKTSVGVSDDVAKVEASKRKIKKGGTKTLSNAELQGLVTRANLEQQWDRLNPSPSKKALGFVADVLLGVGKQQAIKVVGDIAAKQVANVMKKA